MIFAMDITRIDNVVVAGIDHGDYPDYCDAFIESCDVDGREATEKELDTINAMRDYVYEQVIKYIH